MERTTLAVTGMSCNGCEQNVSNALNNLDGVNHVEADHETDTVEIVAADSVSEEDIHGAIESAGYEVSA